MDPYNIPLEAAMSAYAALDSEGKKPTLTEQLLYAILAQLDKANYQLEALRNIKDEYVTPDIRLQNAANMIVTITNSLSGRNGGKIGSSAWTHFAISGFTPRCTSH
jgi:hypothetical protein